MRFSILFKNIFINVYVLIIFDDNENSAIILLFNPSDG